MESTVRKCNSTGGCDHVSLMTANKKENLKIICVKRRKNLDSPGNYNK